MKQSAGPLTTITLLLPSLTSCATKTTTTTTPPPKSPCPASFTGRVPTTNCQGYADCLQGKVGQTYSCTAGTLYDSKSGICNWPSAVTCDTKGVVEEEHDDDDDYYDDDEEVTTVEGDAIVDNFCPAGYTGKAPTTDCLGYVVCTNGEQGLSSKCPIDSLFNSMTLRCEYGFEDCQLLVTQEKMTSNLANYAKYCPDDYTGKAPTENCGGYVKCEKGEVTDALKCPSGTKFDVMKLACTYADVKCGEIANETEQQTQEVKPSMWCPDDYIGRAPTANCLGYVNCKKGTVLGQFTCPKGTLFDVMILACTYSEVLCEATLEATFEPTQSPAGADEGIAKEDRPERTIVSDECPEGFTGNMAVDGCHAYIYCANGEQIAKNLCTSGTVFDPKMGYCNWPHNVDTNVPECATSSPSYSPTLSPINPTISPSYTPTVLDMDGELFYPDYKNGICKNDGKHPASLSKIYLRSTAHGCCTSFFENAYDRCMKAFTSEAPSVAPSDEKIWYPDYDFNLCRNDAEYGEYEINFFASYERCCEFDFLDEIECLAKKPSAMGMIYYPHYPSGLCKNDGRQSNDEIYLYTSKKDCCRNDQMEYDSCMQDKPNVIEQQTTGVTANPTREPTSNPTSEPTSNPTSDPTKQPASEVVTNDYYPDYTNVLCRNDGNAPEFEINFFPTYDLCCQFAWIPTEECRANKPVPDSEKWYPIYSAGHCSNDGNHPKNVLLSETYEKCCDRFMSSNKAKCYSDSKTSLMAPAETPKPTKKPTSKPTTPPTKKPKPTKKPTSTPKPTKKPTSTPKPTKKPTSKPTTPPTKKPMDKMWYPNYGAGHCANDGNHPKNVLLSETYEKCCDRFMSSNKAKCYSDSKASLLAPAETPTPTKKPTSKPTKSPTKHPSLRPVATIDETPSPSYNPTYADQGDVEMWYPIIAQSRCVKLPSAKPDTDPYSTYQECCENPWIHSNVDCIEDAEVQIGIRLPSKENPYYPDYFRGSCKNDGNHPESETDLYGDLDSCCNNPWLDAARCKQLAAAESLSNGGSNPYYPDYFFNICRNDGKQLPAETYLFEEVEDCCGLEYMDDYESCVQLST